jgi:hypothetical protein
MKASSYFFIPFITCLISGCGWQAPEEIVMVMSKVPEKVDFNYHVKPILSDKCFACHGPDMANQKAGLRLDISENAYAALEGSGKHPIIPGKPGKSEMVNRMLSDDPELIMPPPEFNVPLNTLEIATLTKWIEQGAEYKKHWSFIVPDKEQLPSIGSNDWVTNDIDYFVLSKLVEKGLQPSSIASKETLIRRLSFTLLGLPPTLVQIENFVNDTSEDAYEKLIDRMLASSAYGERMAADWMDVARYADSDGYLDDKHRDFSPYRDWVIEAFNENMSYDQFATWQLAGDLIDEPTQESKLATAFNRLHKKNSEAGIVFEEYRVEYVADRTLSLGRAFMGLSVECARCHDHKYDAISQKNHYELFAFFNSTNEIGTAVYGPSQVPGPSLLLTNDEQEKVLQYIDANISSSKEELGSYRRREVNELKALSPNLGLLKSELEKSLQNGLKASVNFNSMTKKNEKVFQTPTIGNKAPTIVSEPDLENGISDEAIFINDFTTVRLPKKVGWFDQSDPFTISLDLYPEMNYEEAVIFTHSEVKRLGLKGYSMHLENNHIQFLIARSWPTNAIQVKTKEPIPVKEWTNVTVSYDGLANAAGVKVFLNGKEVPISIEIDNLYKSILYTEDIHTYGFNGFTLGVRDKFKSFIHGGIDNIKIYDRSLSPLEVQYVMDPDKAFVMAMDEKVLKEFHHLSRDLEAKEKRQKLQKLRRKRLIALEPIKEIMVLGDLQEPRPTYILDRGMYDAPTEEVQPDVPEAIMPFKEGLPRNRLGLSKWLFDMDNPLTARVFVNRIWQMHFGQGLVKTSDDFGNQGSLPSHPELLDWLAVTFMESGWDIKEMHKRILLSSTFQQSSKINSELFEIDVDNVLLARGPTMRMTAEMVRDNALAISGLLSTKIGGASVYPYQPEGLWDEISNKHWRYKYEQETGQGLYRRSLYTIWKRTSAPPSMQIFDAGDRSVCALNRRQTSTPLQALVLLNDPQFVEASYVLAEKVIEAVGHLTQDQLKHAFQVSTGRLPLPTEMKILTKFLDEELKRFSASREDAIAYLSMGETKIKSTSDPVAIAALATVINGVMNTSEGYTIR